MIGGKLRLGDRGGNIFWNNMNDPLEEKYRELLTKRWGVYNSVFGLDNFSRRIEKRLKREGGKKSLEELNKIISIQGKKLLDAGSCCGEFLFEAVLAGAIGYGIEPDQVSLEVSKLLFEIKQKPVDLKQAGVEELPFNDNTFDIVVSIFVLEHVKDQDKAILEMMRVLKPDDQLWLKCPNYLYPREYHYKRYYLPFLPASFNQNYLNLVSGRKTDYYLKLNRTTPASIFKILKRQNLNYVDLSWLKIKHNGALSRILYKIGFYPEINLLITKNK